DALVLGRRFTAEDMLLHYLGLHAWFGDAYALSINDSFWFVTLIATLYLIYAPLRRLAEKPDRLLFAGALVSSAAAVYFFRARQYMAFDHLSLRIPGFFLGLLFGRLLKTGRLDLSASTALGAAFLLLFYVPFTHDFVYATSWVGAALMIGYTCLIRPFFSTGTRGALKFLGDRSLEIFLIHQPLMREYNILAQHELFPTAAVTAASMAAGIVIAVGVSVVIGAALHSLLGALPVPWRLSGQPTHHDNISPR
ncbi:MAG TPA: acyltransferase family protein, partial [Opitutaceae bacterium]|nr:acyltransferase family protein [Opitutaceae bacterium]